MINVDLTNYATSVSLIINRVLPLFIFPIAPGKKILVPNLNFSPIANKIDTELGLVELSLNP